MFKQGTPHICRDETLVLGLVSAIQNGDTAAVELCLSHLSCASRCEEVSVAAANFALVLKALDTVLAPISLETIENAVLFSAPVPQSRTLH